MKWCWANGLRVVAGIALLTGAASARSQQQFPSEENSVVPTAAGAQSSQNTVVAIRVVTEDGRVLSDCPSGVSVEMGKPLNRANVAASLRALYRTGDYSDLRAVITPVPNGLRLDFSAH